MRMFVGHKNKGGGVCGCSRVTRTSKVKRRVGKGLCAVGGDVCGVAGRCARVLQRPRVCPTVVGCARCGVRCMPGMCECLGVSWIAGCVHCGVRCAQVCVSVWGDERKILAQLVSRSHECSPEICTMTPTLSSTHRAQWQRCGRESG